MRIGADTSDHRHLRALSRRGDSLITALSPKKLAKISAEQRLARGWQMRRPRDQINDQAAHHDDSSHYRRSPQECCVILYAANQRPDRAMSPSARAVTSHSSVAVGA